MAVTTKQSKGGFDLERLTLGYDASSESQIESQVVVKHSDGQEYKFDSLADLQRSDKFEDILEDAAKEKVFSIDFKARVFIDKPNLRSWRFEPGDIAGVVSRTKKSDLKLEHSHDQTARIGFVLSPESADSNSAIDMAIQLRAGPSQVQYLKGMFDRYSIGAGGTSAKCSTCGMQYNSYGPKNELRFYPNCQHYPGDKQQNGPVTEMLLVGGRITEVSSVGKPAVDGTGNKTGKTLSAEEDDQMNMEELKAKIAELEATLSATQKRATDAEANLVKANEFACELACDKAVSSRRVTKAEFKGEKIQKLVTVLGVKDALDTVLSWPARPELGADPVLSGDKGKDPGVIEHVADGGASEIVGDTIDGESIGTALRAGTPAKPGEKVPTLFERLKERGDIKERKPANK